MSDTIERFNRLLKAMLTEKPSEKRTAKGQTSRAGSAASYGDTRTREGKSASASSKPKRKSR